MGVSVQVVEGEPEVWDVDELVIVRELAGSADGLEATVGEARVKNVSVICVVYESFVVAS